MTRMRATLRMVMAGPAFAVVVLSTMALGTAAPTAVFSVVHAVLLRPLPYAAPDRLVQFRLEVRHPQGDAAFDALPASAALQWASDSQALSALALYNDRALTLVTAAGPERLSGVTASPNLLGIIGVQPAIGEGFDPATTDERQIILSDHLWRRHFAADRQIVGQPVTLDGVPFKVRGVMPADFDFPNTETAFWTPLIIAPGAGRGMMLPAIARLRPGANIPEVIEEGRRFLQVDDGRALESTLIVRTLHDQLVGSVERVVWLVVGAVGLVTAVATASPVRIPSAAAIG